LHFLVGVGFIIARFWGLRLVISITHSKKEKKEV
jgi:hypothetical protein